MKKALFNIMAFIAIAAFVLCATLFMLFIQGWRMLVIPAWNRIRYRRLYRQVRKARKSIYNSRKARRDATRDLKQNGIVLPLLGKTE